MICWCDAQGSANFEHSRGQMGYFEKYVLITGCELAKSVQVIRVGLKKNSPGIMIPMVFTAINMNHDKLTGY